MCFALYHQSSQIAFGRVITDCATFAYLADVFVLEQFRGKGISKALMKFILEHPQLQNLRRIILATRDAHGLYEQFGFKALHWTERWMEIYAPTQDDPNQ
jgi:GNAT superfamily N-acetyltransferase